MTRIAQIFLYELKRNVKRRGYLFATFGLPVLIFVLMQGYNWITNLQAADDTQPELTELFDFEGIEVAGYVDESGLFPAVPETMAERLIQYEDVASARDALGIRDVDVFYIIAEDYLETGKVTLHVPGFALSVFNDAPARQLIFETLAPDADRSLLSRLGNGANIQQYNLVGDNEAQERNEDADMALLYGFSIAFAMGIMLTNGYLLQTVIEEKENRLIEILISTVRPTQLLAGKILALALLGIVQVAVWIGSAIVLLQMAGTLDSLADSGLVDIQLPVDKLPIMFLYFVLGYLFFGALFATVGAISSSMKEGPQYAVVFTLPAFLPYYFATVFVEQPNSTLPTILSIFPVTSPISMMMRVSVTEVPFEQIALSLMLLVLAAIGAMWMAGRLFRVQTLLAGQTPKIREIPGLIFGTGSSRKAKTA